MVASAELLLELKLLMTTQHNQLNGLEKSGDPELGPTPLKDVCDPVTGNTPLMYAAMENKHTTIERMINLGCDPLAVNREKYSALHLASMYGKEDTVKCLLNYKVSKSKK